MKFASLIMIAALTAAGGAYAQNNDQSPQGAQSAGPQGPGPGQMTPAQRQARRAERQAAMQACQPDMQSLCAGQSGRDAMMCMRQNRDKLSAGCKGALASLRGPRGSRRGQNGGPNNSSPPAG